MRNADEHGSNPDPRRVAVIVSRVDGVVVTANREAERLLGAPDNRPCWQFMDGVDQAGDRPCRDGCVGALHAAGADSAFVRTVTVAGLRYTLCCAPGSEQVISTLVPGTERPTPWERPTPREMDILHLLAEGLTNHEIALALGVKERTVRAHVENLRGKLDVPTRAAIVARAFRMKLLT